MQNKKITTKCSICESRIQKGWKHCPECGIKIKDSKLTHEGYGLERVRSLSVQKDWDSLYTNFKSVEQVGVLPYFKVRPIRPTLGDFVDIHISNLKIYSLLSLQPKCMDELCSISRMLGYYSADYALKTTKLSKIVDIISKTELFWKLITNKEFQKALEGGWKKTHEALIKLESIDKKRNQIIFRVDEAAMFYL